MIDFKKEIERIKKDSSFRIRSKIGEGAFRVVYKTDCGRYVVKRDWGKFANKSEVQLWKKTKSFMLNPVVWHSWNHEWIVQPFCEVVKFGSSKADKTHSEISKYLDLSFMNVNELAYWFHYVCPEFKEDDLNLRLKELHRVWKIANKLGLDDWMDDLHISNWGKDALGRYVIIDYGSHFSY